MDERIKIEHEEQREFVSWFRKNYPGVLIFAIPNGGYRGKGEALRLRVEGVVAGVPDLFIPSWRVFIEMKRTKGGVVSTEQKEIIGYLDSVGYTCLVCYGFEEAKKKIQKPLATVCDLG